MKPSEAFMEMAADIDRNPDKFGGAFVIFPPSLGGDPVQKLIVSNKGNDAETAIFFWNIVQTQITAMLDKLKEQERQGAAFGRR